MIWVICNLFDREGIFFRQGDFFEYGHIFTYTCLNPPGNAVIINLVNGNIFLLHIVHWTSPQKFHGRDLSDLSVYPS